MVMMAGRKVLVANQKLSRVQSELEGVGKRPLRLAREEQTTESTWSTMATVVRLLSAFLFIFTFAVFIVSEEEFVH